MDHFMRAALDEAKRGLAEGGIPIGSVLTLAGEIVGRGHNRRVQSGSPVLHAEMDCLANAGRLTAREYQRATIYTTLSPCDMCSGRHPALQNPKDCYRREPQLPGSRSLLASARRRVSLAG